MSLEDTVNLDFKNQLELMGTTHNANLQQKLREFCSKIAVNTESEYMLAWLDKQHTRPLWQLGIIALMANKGIVMMTYGEDHDADLLGFDLPEGSEAADALPESLPEMLPETLPEAVPQAPHTSLEMQEDLESLTSTSVASEDGVTVGGAGHATSSVADSFTDGVADSVTDGVADSVTDAVADSDTAASAHARMNMRAQSPYDVELSDFERELATLSLSQLTERERAGVSGGSDAGPGA